MIQRSKQQSTDSFPEADIHLTISEVGNWAVYSARASSIGVALPEILGYAMVSCLIVNDTIKVVMIKWRVPTAVA